MFIVLFLEGTLDLMYTALFPRAPSYTITKYCNLGEPLATCTQSCSLKALVDICIQPWGRTALHENEAVSWALFTICQQNCSMRYRWLHICSIVPWGYPSLQVYRSVFWGYAVIYANGIIPRGHPHTNIKYCNPREPVSTCVQCCFLNAYCTTCIQCCSYYGNSYYITF